MYLQKTISDLLLKPCHKKQEKFEPWRGFSTWHCNCSALIF